VKLEAEVREGKGRLSFSLAPDSFRRLVFVMGEYLASIFRLSGCCVLLQYLWAPNAKTSNRWSVTIQVEWSGRYLGSESPNRFSPSAVNPTKFRCRPYLVHLVSMVG